MQISSTLPTPRHNLLGGGSLLLVLLQRLHHRRRVLRRLLQHGLHLCQLLLHVVHHHLRVPQLVQPRLEPRHLQGERGAWGDGTGEGGGVLRVDSLNTPGPKPMKQNGPDFGNALGVGVQQPEPTHPPTCPVSKPNLESQPSKMNVWCVQLTPAHCCTNSRNAPAVPRQRGHLIEGEFNCKIEPGRCRHLLGALCGQKMPRRDLHVNAGVLLRQHNDVRVDQLRRRLLFSTRDVESTTPSCLFWEVPIFRSKIFLGNFAAE